MRTSRPAAHHRKPQQIGDIARAALVLTHFGGRRGSVMLAADGTRVRFE
jgi:hypothetical protein